MANGNLDRHQTGSVPVPNPTELTTDAIALLKSQISELFGQRFVTVEKDMERIGGKVDTEVTHLQVLVGEKLKGVEQQFGMRDVALAAALLAQKTSVEEQNKANALSTAKTEAGFSKLIDGLSALIAAQEKNGSDKITDLKDRLTAIESRGKGLADGYGWLIAGLGLLVGGGGLIAFFAK